MNVAPWTVIGWLIAAILILSIIVTPIALYVMTKRRRQFYESIREDIQSGTRWPRERFKL